MEQCSRRGYTGKAAGCGQIIAAPDTVFFERQIIHQMARCIAAYNFLLSTSQYFNAIISNQNHVAWGCTCRQADGSIVNPNLRNVSACFRIYCNCRAVKR